MGMDPASWAAIASAVAGVGGTAATLANKPKEPDLSAQNALVARQQKQAEDERARLAGEQMSRLRARASGFRGLLSDTRASAEQGLRSTLGPG
jgi:hypothetical protein